MNTQKIQAVILAAGKSSRFNTGKSKLLEKMCGQEIILFITKLLERISICTTVVVGHEKEAIKNIIQTAHGAAISFVEQQQQLGTGHALMCSKNQWFADSILVINGDMPLITQEILETLIEKHYKSTAAITFAIAHNEDPSTGYGRVIKTDSHIEIIEAKHFTGQHCYINAGIYLIQRTFLEKSIANLTQNKITQEFYLPDLVKIASEINEHVETVTVPYDFVRGINNFKELWAAEQIKRSELITYWMEKGVRFQSPHTTQIELGVTIQPGTLIDSSVQLLGNTSIKKNCTIGAFSILKNAQVHNNVTVHSHSVITDSVVNDHAIIGPFAHVHSASTIGEKSLIGNFVEVKNTYIGAESKAKHLAYLGDAQLGTHVNIGAGTITCNHNGFTKHKTIISDKAYIGSNSTLVAPVHVGAHAFTAAGSVITKNVPEYALAIARSRQENKEQYAKKLVEKFGSKEKTRIGVGAKKITLTPSPTL